MDNINANITVNNNSMLINQPVGNHIMNGRVMINEDNQQRNSAFNYQPEHEDKSYFMSMNTFVCMEKEIDKKNAKFFGVKIVPLYEEKQAQEFVLENDTDDVEAIIVPSDAIYSSKSVNPQNMHFGRYILLNGRFEINSLINHYLTNNSMMGNAQLERNSQVYNIERRLEVLEQANVNQQRCNKSMMSAINKVADETASTFEDFSVRMAAIREVLRDRQVIRVDEEIVQSNVPSLMNSESTINICEAKQLVETTSQEYKRTQLQVEVPNTSTGTYARVTINGPISVTSKDKVHQEREENNYASDFPEIDTACKQNKKEVKSVVGSQGKGRINEQKRKECAKTHIQEIHQKSGLIIEKVLDHAWQVQTSDGLCKVVSFNREIVANEFSNPFGTVISFGYLNDDLDMQFAIIAKGETTYANVNSNASVDIILSKRAAVGLGFKEVETELIIVPIIRRPLNDKEYKSGAYIGMYSCLHKKRRMDRYHHMLNILSDKIIENVKCIETIVPLCQSIIVEFFSCFTPELITKNLSLEKKLVGKILKTTQNRVELKHDNVVVKKFVERFDRDTSSGIINCVDACLKSECNAKGMMYGSKIQKGRMDDNKLCYISPCGAKVNTLDEYYDHYCTIRGRAVRFTNPDSKNKTTVGFKCARCFRVYDEKHDSELCNLFCEVIGGINNNSYTSNNNDRLSQSKLNNLYQRLKQ